MRKRGGVTREKSQMVGRTNEADGFSRLMSERLLLARRVKKLEEFAANDECKDFPR